MPIRHDWTRNEARELHDLPLTELLYRAQTVHREHHDPTRVQVCTLLSVKTGGCPEDCAYCSQSVRHDSSVEATPLIELDRALELARVARERGASRFCMGAAWRSVRDGPDFDRVLEMVRGVRELGMEACCTLGMLTASQARRLADAGLTAYNHNLDTGPDFYDRIITTRVYADRLQTLENVRKAGITVCCGGIIGMGETVDDRLDMLCVLANLDPQPESVPINALMSVEGTPLADRPQVDPLAMARVIATARSMMPASMVRLSAGRVHMSTEAQALCFFAGANSIFSGETLLTAANPSRRADDELFARLGLEPYDATVVETPQRARSAAGAPAPSAS